MVWVPCAGVLDARAPVRMPIECRVKTALLLNFFLEDRRLRLAINVDALQGARLTASSGLLALARMVHDTNASKGAADDWML